MHCQTVVSIKSSPACKQVWDWSWAGAIVWPVYTFHGCPTDLLSQFPPLILGPQLLRTWSFTHTGGIRQQDELNSRRLRLETQNPHPETLDHSSPKPGNPLSPLSF